MLRWFTTLLTIAVIAATSRAQSNSADVMVVLSARDQVAYVGDSVIINVSVVNAENPEAPEITFPDDFAVQPMARQDATAQFITEFNGRRSVRREYRFTYPFLVTPRSTGRFALGPARVRVGGVVHESDTLQILVQEPEPRDDLQLRLDLDKENAYVGEPVTMTATWMMRSNISNQFRFTLPGMPSTIEVHDLPTPAPNAHDIRAGRFAELEFLGSTVLAERGVLVEDGREWTTYTFRKTLTPTATGEFAIGPAYFRGNVEIGRRRNGLFGEEPVHERAVVPSNEISLRVIPLPDSGQPGDFSGLVGAYRVTSRLSRTEMKVGDPVKLTIRITGPSPIERTRSLNLLDEPDLTSEFRVSPDDTTTRVDGGTLLIETTIRPLDERVDELPSLSFPYFDPELGEYQIAASRPIPVIVQPTRIVTIDDAIGDARQPRAIDSNIGGFAHSYPIDTSEASPRFDTLAFIRSPLAITALAAPPALWALISVVTIARRAHAERAHRLPGPRAAASARSAIHRADDVSAVAAALRTYLHVRLNVPPAPSPDEVAGVLADHDEQLAERASSLLRRLDEACFAGGATTTETLCDESLAVLNAVESIVRRSR